MLGIDPSRMTVRQLIDRYLHHVTANRAASTAASYTAVLEHAEPINNRYLTEVRPLNITELTDGIQSPHTRHRLYKILKACFTQATKWRIITADMHPFFGLSAPEYSAKEPSPFEPVDVDAIYEAASDVRGRCGQCELSRSSC